MLNKVKTIKIITIICTYMCSRPQMKVHVLSSNNDRNTKQSYSSFQTFKQLLNIKWSVLLSLYEYETRTYIWGLLYMYINWQTRPLYYMYFLFGCHSFLIKYTIWLLFTIRVQIIFIYVILVGTTCVSNSE